MVFVTGVHTNTVVLHDMGVQVLVELDIGVQILAHVNVKLRLRWLPYQVNLAGAILQAMEIFGADGDDVFVWELAGLKVV